MSENICGDCRLCCKVMTVEAIDKPQGKWCAHCNVSDKAAGGCKIYETRPQGCRVFNCLYVEMAQRGDPMPIELRPDRTRVVIVPTGERMAMHVDEGMPDAWRKGRIARFIAYVRQNDIEVVIVVGDRQTRLPPKS